MENPQIPRDQIKCNCGNLHISGKKCQINHHLGLSRSILRDIQMHSEKHQIVQIRSGSIGVNNIKKISCRKIRTNIFYVLCESCNSILIVYLGKGAVYAQFSSTTIKDRLRFYELVSNNPNQGNHPCGKLFIEQNSDINNQKYSIIYQMIRVDEISQYSAVTYDDPITYQENQNAVDANSADDCIANDENEAEFDLMFSGDAIYSMVGSMQPPTTLGLYV